MCVTCLWASLCVCVHCIGGRWGQRSQPADTSGAGEAGSRSQTLIRGSSSRCLSCFHHPPGVLTVAVSPTSLYQPDPHTLFKRNKVFSGPAAFTRKLWRVWDEDAETQWKSADKSQHALTDTLYTWLSELSWAELCLLVYLSHTIQNGCLLNTMQKHVALLACTTGLWQESWNITRILINFIMEWNVLHFGGKHTS